MYWMRSRVLRLGLVVAALVGLQTTAAFAQGQPQQASETKLTKEQRAEVENLVKLLDQVLAGKPAPSDVTLSWANDFMKALDGRTYVPFTISFDPAQLTSSNVALYFRVVPRPVAGAAAAPPAGERRDDKEKEKEKEKEAARGFEGIHFVDLKTPEEGQHRVRRAFAVPAGDYDAYVIVKEQVQKGKPAKTTFLKQPVSVPNYWNDELATSTVIMADRLEPAPALSQNEQAENPYTLGTTRIVPAVDTKFLKNDELSLVFLIYNAALKSAKPDVTVEYNFHQQTPEGEKYFNKTNPQQFNAQTLPPQFDMAAGHQLVAGQSVPLASFPAGDYRLEIKITDNAAGKNLIRDVKFTVAGP